MPATLSPDTHHQQHPLANSVGDPIADADTLLNQTRTVSAEESGDLPDMGGSAAVPAVAEQYADVLAETVEERHEQAVQIEERLEGMIEAQGARLLQVQSHPPGMFARPGTREKWQAQVAQVQATMQRLQTRLETVREIRDGITSHGHSKIEELAAHKIAHRQPELADDFAATEEARRRYEVMMREEQARKRRTEQVAAQGVGLSQKLAQGLASSGA